MNGTQKLDTAARWLKAVKAHEIFTDPQKGIDEIGQVLQEAECVLEGLMQKTEVDAPFKLTAAQLKLIKSTLNKPRSVVADILEPLQAALENKQQELHNGGKPSSNDK